MYVVGLKAMFSNRALSDKFLVVTLINSRIREKIMTIQSELETIIDNLKFQRDEINLQMHLASMDAKDEWEKAEEQWDDLKDKVEDIADEAKETGEEFVDAAKTIAEEITLAYGRIKERLKD